MSLAQSKLYSTAMRLFAQKSITQITIKELAEAAGVARGTIYNNFSSVEQIFEDIATQVTAEMTDKITAELVHLTHPAERLSTGIRIFIQYATQDPVCGQFILRFAVTTPTLNSLFKQTPYQDLVNGIEQGVFLLPMSKVDSAIALLSGGVLANIGLVLEGYKTWREAGSNLASFLLTAFGVPSDTASELANMPLLKQD